MNKFKVGDRIVANESAKSMYSVTIKDNGFGIVREICGDNSIEVSWSKSSCGQDVFRVDQRYFELDTSTESSMSADMRSYMGSYMGVPVFKTNFVTEENKMELNEINKENLKEAQRKFNEERSTAETEFALKQLRILTDEKESYERTIKSCQEKVKEINDKLKVFK